MARSAFYEELVIPLAANDKITYILSIANS